MATKKAPAKKTVAPVAAKSSARSSEEDKLHQEDERNQSWSNWSQRRWSCRRSKLQRFFDLLASTAIQETKKNGEFTIPGLGKLVKAQRAARIGRNPQTGEAIKIKAKTAVKFRVAKAAKDLIAPVK